jgi:hypothetical protein
MKINPEDTNDDPENPESEPESHDQRLERIQADYADFWFDTAIDREADQSAPKIKS